VASNSVLGRCEKCGHGSSFSSGVCKTRKNFLVCTNSRCPPERKNSAECSIVCGYKKVAVVTRMCGGRIVPVGRGFAPSGLSDLVRRILGRVHI
jgi:hypothetical protein